MTAWTDSLGLPAEAISEAFTRANQISAEVGDTTDLEMAFDGLPDAVQRAAWTALAQPHRRVELIDSLSDADFDQLTHFLDTMTDAEHVAIARTLGL